jgi:hypothetical protein
VARAAMTIHPLNSSLSIFCFGVIVAQMRFVCRRLFRSPASAGRFKLRDGPSSRGRGGDAAHRNRGVALRNVSSLSLDAAAPFGETAVHNEEKYQGRN